MGRIDIVCGSRDIVYSRTCRLDSLRQLMTRPLNCDFDGNGWKSWSGQITLEDIPQDRQRTQDTKELLDALVRRKASTSTLPHEVSATIQPQSL